MHLSLYLIGRFNDYGLARQYNIDLHIIEEENQQNMDVHI